MRELLFKLKSTYRDNPGWCWLVLIISTFFILPEYISPFLLFIGFIVFKRQWTREGKKARIGTSGKVQMIFMCYMMLSVLWSPTILDTVSMAALWFGMFLIQVMIYNLARTREKIDKLIKCIVFGAGANGLIASIQICTYILKKNKIIDAKYVLTTPFYKKLDYEVYSALPFDISTKTFSNRASGFFSNPNLLATFMVLSYPLSIYLFLNAKSKKTKVLYFVANVLISCGLSATMTRAGCIVALLGWVFIFIVQGRRHILELVEIGIPTFAVIIPSILTRYGIIFKSHNGVKEAKKSSAAHFDIWYSLLDYISEHTKAFFIGTGFGCEQTGNILLGTYGLNKPHAHNFVIEIWTELGIVGMLLLAAILILAFKKMAEINANNEKKYGLVLGVTMSLCLMLAFGLSDYIFGSPKQIFMFLMLMGLIQSIYYSYQGIEIRNFNDLKDAFRRDYQNAVK